MPIKVNETVIPFKLDTGAHVNLLSWEDYKIMTVKSKIHPIKTKVTGYTGERIPVKGGCIATFQHKGQQIQAQLLIVDANVQPILGLKTCTKLNLVKRVFVVTSPGTVNDHDSLMEEYKDCFEGLGCLPGEHKIFVDKSVSPVVHPCRKIPFALRNKLKEELVRMEKLGVIKKIDEPTEWVSSLVVVQKKTGALRTCLDPRDLNKAIKREHFKLPTREEIMAQFAGAKWFSKLDASSGFWQLRLDEESSRLCTFNTPEGRYRFLRLPYGILSAPEVYHKTIHMIFEHIPGVETMMDDIIVWGSTRAEHDERLRQVLDKTREVNLKLNKDKCEFGVKTLTFMGDVVSEEGVKPDPRKTSAINNMETPKNKDEVRRFLGMVTYLAKFVPQLSAQSAPLRILLEQKNEWVWSHEQEQCFLKLKKILTQEPVLQFYDPERSTRISADA
uniref:ribonuclease H n=1 Tax=Cyprinodon variegatus TaxID=28743 RepID=A0A3Q2DAV3_CYPVA